jgi:hypothetical protein
MLDWIPDLSRAALIGGAVTVLAAQGTVMAADEFVFHRGRAQKMPRWERLGHPLDTLTVLIPVLMALLLPPSRPWTLLFAGLALFSCLFVTKDEAVHARQCTGGEQWLHAILFLLHPLLFAAVYVLWMEGGRGWISLQALLAAGFLCWQLFYWNGPWAPRLYK